VAPVAPGAVTGIDAILEESSGSAAVIELLLPDQLDDDWAAVRAVGSGGSRSLAVSVPAPRVVTH